MTLESPAGVAALAGVGLDVVGEVMGCVVVHLGGARAWCGLGYLDGTYAEPVTRVSGRDPGFVQYGEYAQTAWDTTRARLFREAAALAADGVVGITAIRGPMPGAEDGEEFLLRGTAVRARGRVHPLVPFGTEQHGAGVAALLRSGFAPAGYAVTVAVGIRHDDWQTRQANTVWSPNEEIPGYTDLAQQTRQVARDRFAHTLTALGATGVLASDITATMLQIEPADAHTDHLCEVTVTGSGLVSFRRSGVPPPLTVLPLSAVTQGRGVTTPATPPAPPPPPIPVWTRLKTALTTARVRWVLRRRTRQLEGPSKR